MTILMTEETCFVCGTRADNFAFWFIRYTNKKHAITKSYADKIFVCDDCTSTVANNITKKNQLVSDYHNNDFGEEEE